jgi:hypothetical protein
MPWCLLLYPPRDRYCVATILFSNPRYQPSHPIPHLLGPTTSGRANGDQQTDYRAPLGIPAWRPKELALLWKTHQPDGTFSTRLRSENFSTLPRAGARIFTTLGMVPARWPTGCVQQRSNLGTRSGGESSGPVRFTKPSQCMQSWDRGECLGWSGEPGVGRGERLVMGK